MPANEDDGEQANPSEQDQESTETADDVSVAWGERMVMAVALGFTAALFSFAVWQSFAGATAAAPSAAVTDVEGETEDAIYHVVTLRNEGDVGLVSATVVVECPTPTRSVTFENVPARARRNATVSCPADGDPNAAVTTWIPE